MYKVVENIVDIVGQSFGWFFSWKLYMVNNFLLLVLIYI